MKKTLIALSIFAFVGSIATASTTLSQDKAQTELADGGKDKKKKKKKCAEDCAKECCTKDEKAAAKSSCAKSKAGKSCCSKAKKTEDKE